MILSSDIFGSDIAKNWIDTFQLSPSQHRRIPATKQALARFAKPAAGGLIGRDASGGHQAPLLQTLAKAGFLTCASIRVTRGSLPAPPDALPKPTVWTRRSPRDGPNGYSCCDTGGCLRCCSCFRLTRPATRQGVRPIGCTFATRSNDHGIF